MRKNKLSGVVVIINNLAFLQHKMIRYSVFPLTYERVQSPGAEENFPTNEIFISRTLLSSCTCF